MSSAATPSTRGVLDPQRGRTRFALTQLVPPPDLAGWIEGFWIVRWDLRDEPAYVSETLPHPSVNVVIDPTGTRAWGVWTRRFKRRLSGAGVGVATRFRPGGFHAVLGRPVCELTDRTVPLRRLLGDDAEAWAADVLALDDADVAGQIALVEGFWRERLGGAGGVPEPERQVAAIRAMLDGELASPSASVEEMARRFGYSVRSLQRLFRTYVGVSPRWVMQRYRLHEAAERIAHGQAPDLAALAADLGYADQAHFSNEFRAYVGRSPAAYAAACANAAAALRGEAG